MDHHKDKQVPHKGILNHKKIEEKKDLTWDEKAIEEHDKERGKTMKITEPKTPYNPEFDKNELTKDSENDHLHQAEENRLAYEAQQQQGKLDLSKLNEMLKDDLDREQQLEGIRKEMALDSDEENEIQRKKKEAFNKKRKEHYNEGAFIKQHQKMDVEDD